MLCLLVCYQAWMQGNVVGMWTLASEVIWLFPCKTSLFHNHAVYIFGGVFSLFLHHFNSIVSFFIPKTWTTGKIKSSLSIHVPVIFLVCSLSAVTRSTSKTPPPQLLQLLGTDATIKVSTSLMCAFSHSVMSEPLWPMECSPPGPSFCGISQARILEWVATSFSRGSS